MSNEQYAMGKETVKPQTSNEDACGLHPDRLCRVGTSNLKLQTSNFKP